MNYLSYQYLIFCFLLFLVYYSVASKHRWKVLLTGNIFFLVCASSFIQILLFFLLYMVCFLGGRILCRLPQVTPQKRTVLIVSVSLIICPFVISRICRFIEFGGVNHWFTLGISFWTLQMVSYLVDIYRRKAVACNSPAKLLLYFSFFPQIVQGPIPRYSDLYPQLISGKNYDSQNTDLGIMRILYGFFLKLMIADKAKVIVDSVFADWENYSGIICWIAAVLYSIELYTDFMACVEISRGVGSLFGINLSQNFDRPYLSASIKEFWRKWHITLSAWLRDYIYFPLGGSKKGKARKYGNILIVFIFSGFWHGGGATFLVWGLMHGIYQIIEDVFGIRKGKNSVSKGLQTGITFILVTIAWVMFRADSVGQGIGIIFHMFLFRDNINSDFCFWDLGLSAGQWSVLLSAILVLLGTENLKFKKMVEAGILRSNIVVRGIFYVVFGVMLAIFGTYGYGYNAQDFIYGGF